MTGGKYTCLVILLCLSFVVQAGSAEDSLSVPFNGQTLYIDGDATFLRTVNVPQIEALWRDTQAELTGDKAESAVALLNEKGVAILSPWLFQALSLCEKWFARTEGKVSCRNGALLSYWQQHIYDDGPMERREARRLARQSRVAKVQLDKTTLTANVLSGEQLIWNLTFLNDGIVLDRIYQYLSSLGAPTGLRLRLNGLTVNLQERGAENGKAEERQIIFAASLNGRARKIMPGAAQFGVLDHSDGWPVSERDVRGVANSATEAAMVAYLGAVASTRELAQFADEKSQVYIQTIDRQERVFATPGYYSKVGMANETRSFDMTMTLPEFNIPNYHGPYVAVWLTNNRLEIVKHLAIRGNSERWLSELRTWWRKVGRMNSDLIDGFAGATRKNHSLTLHWDGYNEAGKPEPDTLLVLHIEVAREEGGRDYIKVPLDLSAPWQDKIVITGTGEIGTIALWQ